MSILWLAHLSSVAFMTGLIWLVQLVHYPLMRLVDPRRFAEFHALHSSRITFIVGPAMVLQLVTAGALVLSPAWNGVSVVVSWTCLVLSVGVFASTAFLSVPQHAILGSGFDVSAHSSLVTTNWVRTLLWSLHLGVCLWASVNRQGG